MSWEFIRREGTKEAWWRLDEKNNALDYLEMGVRSLMEVERTPWAWKWVCIALHGALYGFGVCALQGTNYELVLERDKNGNVKRDNNGNAKLLRFDEVINRCKDKQCILQGVISKPLILDENQEKAIEFMKNKLRNPLEHFIPCSWSLEIHGLPEMAVSYFEIIEFLAGEPGNLRWKGDEIARIKALCNSGKELALSTKIHWEILGTTI